MDAATGSDADEGSTWALAKATIQAGIDAASMNACEVWVANGDYVATYKPDPFGPDQTATILLADGVVLRGGFVYGDLDPDDRDLQNNATVVSGEIGSSNSVEDNIDYLVTTSGTNVMDGLHLVGSNHAIGCDSNLTLVNMEVYENRRDEGAGGGAVARAGCTLLVQYSAFHDNYMEQSSISYGGAAIHALVGSSVTVEDSQFFNNTQRNRSCCGDRAQGGAIGAWGALTVRRTVFTENRASGNSLDVGLGGAIFQASIDSPMLVEDSEFYGNSAWGDQTYSSGSGGAIAFYSGTIKNCVFEGNLARGSGSYGGAIYKGSGSGDGRIENSHFTLNDAHTPNELNGLGGAVYHGDGRLEILDCDFVDNEGSGGGAIGTGSAADGTWIVDSTFLQNTALNTSTSATSNTGGGGGIHLQSPANIVNCLFSYNSSGSIGGAIYARADADPVAIINTTVFANTARYGGALLNRSDNVSILNTIFWGDAATTSGNEIYQPAATDNLVILNSNIQGTGYSGASGNIDTDPSFVDTALATLDLRLQPGSACEDAGDSSLLPADELDVDGDGDTAEVVPLDLDGDVRFAGSEVDMGAYEN